MEHPGPHVHSTGAVAPVTGNGATPFSQHPVVLTKPASIELKWQANDWRAHHERLLKRAAVLQADVAALQAPVRDLPQRLSGTQSAPSARPDSAGASTPTSPRHRGQQPGSRGHGRRDRAARPVVVEGHDVSEAANHCPACGAAFVPFPGSAESTLSAVQVQAHIRRIQRQRYPKTCQCRHVPGMVTAPPAPRLIPQSPLGVSVWTMVLLDKDL